MADVYLPQDEDNPGGLWVFRVFDAIHFVATRFFAGKAPEDSINPIRVLSISLPPDSTPRMEAEAVFPGHFSVDEDPAASEASNPIPELLALTLTPRAVTTVLRHDIGSSRSRENDLETGEGDIQRRFEKSTASEELDIATTEMATRLYVDVSPLLAEGNTFDAAMDVASTSSQPPPVHPRIPEIAHVTASPKPARRRASAPRSAALIVAPPSPLPTVPESALAAPSPPSPSTPKRAAGRRKHPRYSDPLPAAFPRRPAADALCDAEYDIPESIWPATDVIIRFVGVLFDWQRRDLRRIRTREAMPTSGGTGVLLIWDTGMGKTVVSIAVICDSAAEARSARTPTLILCPNAEIMSQWHSEIRKYSKGLRVYFYHGTDSSSQEVKQEPDVLTQYDVVIATYNQVVRQHEYKTKVDCGTISPAEARQDHYPFYLLEWGRLIADESHSMRSPTGKTAAACWALQAGKALLLSATPAQNYPCDMYPQFRLMGRDYGELAKLKEFEHMWNRTLQCAGSNKWRFLKDILPEVTIYRPKISSKGERMIDIPPRHDHAHFLVKLSAHERELYCYIVEVHPHLGRFAKLVRMRQVVIEPKLLLQALLPSEERDPDVQEDKDINELAVVLAQRSIQVGPKQSDVLSTTTRLPAAIEHLAPLLEERYLSTKIRKALKILEEIRTGSAGKDKTIVYSNFKGPLETLSRALTAQDVTSVLYHGDITTKHRQAALARIAADAACTVLLMTIQSGGTGLNITACNHVVFLDPWWNPYLEEQAVGRAHRIGQTKPVHVYRVIADATIETDDVLRIQRKKRENIEALMKAAAREE